MDEGIHGIIRALLYVKRKLRLGEGCLWKEDKQVLRIPYTFASQCFKNFEMPTRMMCTAVPSAFLRQKVLLMYCCISTHTAVLLLQTANLLCRLVRSPRLESDNNKKPVAMF